MKGITKKKEVVLVRKELRLEPGIVRALEIGATQQRRGLINYMETLMVEQAARIIEKQNGKV